MGSSFTFSRPRGVPGNYIVDITLELQSGESATVFISQENLQSEKNKNQSQLASPVEPLERSETTNGSLILKYLLKRIVVDNSITIELHNSRQRLFQRIVYVATKQGFSVKKMSLHLSVDTWPTEGNAISLIDCDMQLQQTNEFPYVEMRVLEVRHGFQIRQYAGNALSDQKTLQKLFEETFLELSPSRPIAYLN